MMRVWITWGPCLAVTAWFIWAAHWSPSAISCFERGGTNFDPIAWGCHKHTRI